MQAHAGPLPAREGREIDAKLVSVSPLAELRRSGEARQGVVGVELGGRRLNFVVACLTAMLAMLVVGPSPASAVESISVTSDAPAIDLTDAAERHRTEADRLLVSAAPGPDGIIRRMDVRAREGNTNWAVFALANSGNEQIERLIVVPHYRMVGSGVFWPDLGRSRVASITSSGERPERQDSATADIFRIILDPGSVMTYVLELRADEAGAD